MKISKNEILHFLGVGYSKEHHALIDLVLGLAWLVLAYLNYRHQSWFGFGFSMFLAGVRSEKLFSFKETR